MFRIELPHTLQNAIDELLESIPASALAPAASRQSERYRTGLGTSSSQEEALAYAAVRMPATYGALYASLSAVMGQWPDFTPESLLDVGAGTGTALWTAAELFPSLSRITALEREPIMRDTALKLLQGAVHPGLQHIQWIQADLQQTRLTPHDLVIASYVLGELPPPSLPSIIDALWSHAGQLLLIVEPGTPAGFERIRAVRQRLIGMGAHVVAPCPHNDRCPLPASDWCHFSQRIARSRRHRQLKAGTAPFEDEKYAYVALTAGAIHPAKSRVLRHPAVHPGHIRLQLCTPQGLASVTVTKKNREAFRRARKARWGDAWSPGGDDAP